MFSAEIFVRPDPCHRDVVGAVGADRDDLGRHERRLVGHGAEQIAFVVEDLRFHGRPGLGPAFMGEAGDGEEAVEKH